MKAHKAQYEKIIKVRILLIIYFFVFIFLLLSFFYNQIIRYKYYYIESLNNMTRKIEITAERGKIFDRNGKILVKDVPSYNLNIIPKYIYGKKRKQKREELFSFLKKLKFNDTLAYLTDKDMKKFWKRVVSGYYSTYLPVNLINYIDNNVIAKVEETPEDLPGLQISSGYKRYSIYKNLFSHITGYVDVINDVKKLKKDDQDKYKIGDRRGKTGLENQYESILRGKNGYYYIEVNSRGKKVKILDNVPYVNSKKGNNLVLTIDYDIQKSVMDAFPDSLNGSFVAIDPNNGEVLAMYSSPSYNPNIFNFSKNIRNEEWKKLALNRRNPISNRAIRGLYPPGSVFKMITALSALIYNGYDPRKSTFKCTGKIKYGNRYFHCWNKYGHGRLNMYHAIEQSCNVYFYQTGIETGYENIHRIAAKFGLDNKTGIDLPNEKYGRILTPEIYEKKYSKRGWRWSKGMTLNMAIGQGATETTLQIANYFAALANKKYLYKPHLVKYITDGHNGVIKRFFPTVINTLNIDSSKIDVVVEGMDLVVNGKKGTAKRSALKTVTVVGKTGSSQTIRGKPTTALFAGFAPKKNPKIAWACIVEDGGHGGHTAAPIVGKVLKSYFNAELIIDDK